MSDDTVGAVISRVTVVAVTAVAGPAVDSPSVTELLLSVRITVPAEQLVIEIVTVVPDVELGVPRVHPVAVPVRVKSAVARPVIDSSNVMV